MSPILTMKRKGSTILFTTINCSLTNLSRGLAREHIDRHLFDASQRHHLNTSRLSIMGWGVLRLLPLPGSVISITIVSRTYRVMNTHGPIVPRFPVHLKLQFRPSTTTHPSRVLSTTINCNPVSIPYWSTVRIHRRWYKCALTGLIVLLIVTCPKFVVHHEISTKEDEVFLVSVVMYAVSVRDETTEGCPSSD